MIIYDTCGKEHNWTPKGGPRKKRSSYHLAAMKLIKSIYPMDNILEEVSVPGERLFLDIFLPVRRLVIEVNGQQHYEFNSHFYDDKLDFGAAQGRDKRKQEWCEINEIELVVLDSKDDEQHWQQLILER